MPSCARLLRIWRGSQEEKCCRDCRKRIALVKDDRGRTLPFKLHAQPLRWEWDETLRIHFAIYEPTAYHDCPARKRRSAQPDARQESWL